MASPRTRRDFVAGTAAAAVAAGVPLSATVAAGNPNKADTGKILNYNPDMEYRPCGKTNLLDSTVCLGGHWKRVNAVVPGLFAGGNWLGAKLDMPEFEKNRTDIVTRCIERGINYIDAWTGGEVMSYRQALKGRRDKMYLGFSYYQWEMRGLGGQWQQAQKKGEPKPGMIAGSQFGDASDMVAVMMGGQYRYQIAAVPGQELEAGRGITGVDKHGIRSLMQGPYIIVIECGNWCDTQHGANMKASIISPEWFASPLGAYLLEREQVYYDRVVADIFGFYAVQIRLDRV